MRNSQLLICLLLVNISSLLAQEKKTISGYIRDESTGEDLVGATVYIVELETGNITNVYGFYSISIPPGTYTVRVTYIGFEMVEKQIEVNANITLDVDLPTQFQALDEVVVTAEAQNENVVSNEISTIRLSSKTVKEIPAVLGEPDIVKSIQLLPGITSVGDGASGFNVRGGSADQNLILLDEGVIYNSAHLLGFYSTINPDAVKDIKIYKGGIPARYGGRLSSVLDVRQKEGNLKEYSGEGGVSLISARGLFEGPIVKDKGSFMIAGRRSYGDALLNLFESGNTAYFYDLNLKTNYKINDKNRVFLSGYFGRDKLELGSVFSNGWGNATGTFRWNTVITPNLFANVSAIYSNYDYTVNDLTPASEYELQSNIINYHLKTDLTYFLEGKNTLDFGLDQKWYTFKPGEISPIEGSNITPFNLDEKYAIEQGAYVSFHQEVGDLIYDVGIRGSRFLRTGNQEIPVYENNQPVVYNGTLNRYEEGAQAGTLSYGSSDNISRFSNLEPRVGLTYVLNDRQSIKGSYNRMYQYLHLISNTQAPSPLDTWVPSGPFIEPQSADQYALGFFMNFQENMYEASIETYYKDIRNMVDYVDGADILANNQIETVLLRGDGRSYGVELFVKKNMGRLTGWLSYTLSQSERKVLGINAEDPGINNGEWYPTNFDKRHDFSAVAVYDLNDRWSLSGNFVFASGIPSTFPTGRYQYGGIVMPHYDQRNQNRLPAYHRLDVSATLKPKMRNGKPRKGSWTFGIFNLYNRANATSIYFTEDADNRGETKAYQTYLFGVTPNIAYNLKF